MVEHVVEQLPGPLPSPGDVLCCHFPNFDPKEDTAKERPCLVISVMDTATPVRLRVAYGTTQKVEAAGRGDFIVEKKKHLTAAGLFYKTRFSLRNICVLDYTEHWFRRAPLPGGLTASTPKMGVLAPELIPLLQRAAEEAGIVPKKRPSR